MPPPPSVLNGTSGSNIPHASPLPTTPVMNGKGTNGVMPLQVIPSSAAYEAMASSQRKHIDELSQSNQTLKHTVKKCQEALETERLRFQQALADAQERMAAEANEWTQKLELIQSCHRISARQIEMELNDTRDALESQHEQLKKERRGRVQLQYKVDQWQEREAELEARTLELELELERALDKEGERDSAQSQVQGVVAELQRQLAMRAKEMTTLKSKLDQVTAEHRSLQTTHKSSTSDMERLQLQLDAATTSKSTLENQHSELKKLYEESKKEAASLSGQIEKWKTRDERGSAETEELRQREAELEGRVKQLEKEREDLEKVRAKAERKTERFRAALEEQAKHTTDANEIIAKRDDEVMAAREQLQDAQQRIAELESRLASTQVPDSPPARPAKSATANSTALQKPKGKKSVPNDSGSEIELVQTRPGASSTRNDKSKSRSTGRDIVHSEEDEVPAPPPLKKGAKGKARATTIDVESDGEDPAPAKPVGKNKKAAVENDDLDTPPSKPKPKPKPRTKAISVEDESDAPSQSQPKPKPKPKAKPKATPLEVSDSDAPPPKPKKPKPGPKGIVAQGYESSDEPPAKSSKPKPKPRMRTSKGVDGAENGGEEDPPAGPKKRGRPPGKKKDGAANAKEKDKGDDEEAAEEESKGPKKKKRKINIFQGAKKETFNWESVNNGNAGDLGIPMDLSPVKGGEPVAPKRSLFGKR